tara:strand:+ start:103 stop:534 length:432 start_codon:yes stop_codon:yes gene_type:complete
MDRHHLLSLLDKIQEKYEIQDGEYKEFAEAIGGKKSPIEVNEGDLVRVSYDFLECEVDFCEDEFYPKVHVTERCSRIWKITANETDYHGESMISYRYMHNSEMHLGAMRKIVKDYSNNKFTTLTLNSSNNRKYCFRVFEIEVI